MLNLIAGDRFNWLWGILILGVHASVDGGHDVPPWSTLNVGTSVNFMDVTFVDRYE